MSANSSNNVVLVSAEGAEIVLTEEEASVSKALRHMLTSGESIEAQTRRVALPLFNKETLETVVRYFRYKLRYENSTEKNVPEFEMDPRQLIDVLKAANYLEC